MAFPAVVGTPAETALVTAGTSHVITLPTVLPGNLILILLNKGTAAASTMNALTGWTELADENQANGMFIACRTADGTEGSTVTFTSTASIRNATIAYAISGAMPVDQRTPELSTVATGTSINPNATTVTPTGGSKDYLWITLWGLGAAGEAVDNDTFTSAAPASYGTLVQKACGTVGTNLGGIIASAHRTNTASSEDAGSFTITSATWRAFTVAVHPYSWDETVAAAPGIASR